jgi:hypothetical protein
MNIRLWTVLVTIAAAAAALVLTPASLAAPGLNPQPVVVADNGLARLPIVHAATASQKTIDAAHTLADYLQRITGAAFAVQIGDGTTGIALGDVDDFPALPAQSYFDRLADIDAAQGQIPVPGMGDRNQDAFVVLTHSSGLYLIGMTDSAVELAVWRYLYTLGYRQFFPTATWEVVPSLSHVESRLALHYRPRFLAWQNSENGGFANIVGYQELFRVWQRKNGLSDLAQINQWQITGSIIRDGTGGLPTDYAAEFAAHPEYLTVYDEGDQLGETGTKFCVTEPGLQTLAITYAKEWLTAHPGNTTVSMAPSDGEYDWNGCANGEHTRYTPTERMVLLANAVAQALQADPAYAGTHVAVLAYGLTSQPPVQVTLDRFVHVSFVDHKHFKGGGSAASLIEGWKAKEMTTFNIYEYLNVQSWSFDLPGSAKVTRYGEMASTIKNYYDWGARYLISEGGTAWGPNGLGFWLLARMLCEPEKLDDPAVLARWQSDFLQKAFGPAEAPMRAFYSALAGEPHAPLLSRDLIGQLYGKLAEARGLTVDAAILARLDDLALYVRFVELTRAYRTAAPADAQAAFDALGQFAYLINDRVMLDRYLMPVIDSRDTDVVAPAGTSPGTDPAGNPWGNPAEDADNSDFVDTDFTTAEVSALIADGIVANPLKPFATMSYSADLIPAVALALPATTRIDLTSYLLDAHRWWVWVDVPQDLQYTVAAGMVPEYRNRGDTTLKLFGPGGTVAEDEATLAPTGIDEAVLLTATSAGLHTLEVADSTAGVDIEWDTALPMVMGIGEGDAIPYAGTWSGYFYVPKGTAVIGAYYGGGYNRSEPVDAVQIVDPDGNVAAAPETIPWYDHFTVTVPVGQDGRLWKVENAFGDRFRLYTVPAYIARSAQELLLPGEVVAADAAGP